jgi:Flp pilus assembly protein TadD
MKRLLLLLLALAIPCTDAHCETRYALVIGISGYPHFSDNKKLKYAGSDAQQFASFIETPDGGGFLPDNVHLLVNNQATRENIFNAFTWLRSHVGPDDILYVYFAGHGDKFGDNSYFLPYDTSPSQPDDRGIPMHDFYRKVTTDLQARQVIIFIDACHAAGADSARGTSSENGQDPWNTLNRKAGQVTMGFFSSLANEESYEDDTFKQGLFTHFLLEGLKGAANATPDGHITAENLYNFVSRAVYQRSTIFPDHQTPQRSSEFTGTYILSKTPKIVLTSGDASAHHSAGVKLIKNNKTAEAIAEFREAIRIEPDDASTHEELGVALLYKFDWTSSLEELKKAQSLKPDLPDLMSAFSIYYYLYGMSFAQDKKWDDAIAQYEQSMHYKPDDPDLYMQWGFALAGKDNYKEAAAKFATARALNPSTPNVDQKMGTALLLSGDTKGAIDAYKAALLLKPDDPKLHGFLGIAYEVTHDYTAALDELRRALALSPNDPLIQRSVDRVNNKMTTNPTTPAP